MAVNAPIEKPLLALLEAAPRAVSVPPYCVRDLDPAFREFRRVTFNDFGSTPSATWSIGTDIIRPGNGPALVNEATLAPFDESDSIKDKSFEEYLTQDGLVDWNKKHVCIFFGQNGAHKQLWVLFNGTNALHNFHIHQMKFRLATQVDLADHGLSLPAKAQTCGQGNCTEPNYQLYDDKGVGDTRPEDEPVWHDTIPIPPFERVYIVMSFDAPEQIGRFVFHCHILKHEDKGLMAPIEVVDSSSQ